jgi:POLQ-like helicase
MIGRAGRAGLIDSVGESILLFKLQDKQKVVDLITGPMKRCDSSFQGDDSKAMRVLVLSLIGLNLTHLGSQILLFVKQTLFYLQQKDKLLRKENSESKCSIQALTEDEKRIAIVPDDFDLISNALVYLLKSRLIEINSSDPLAKCTVTEITNVKALYYVQFEITKLGLATTKGNIDLDYVDQLYVDLKTGLKTMVLSNYLHLIYLCTPYELINSLNNIDLDTYINKVN